MAVQGSRRPLVVVVPLIETPGPLDTPCRRWTGYRNRHGYGRKKVAGRWHLVHRLVWEQVHGPVPDGLELMHLCEVPACCALDHLRVGTHAENMRQAATNGRFPTKLTPDDVRAVRAALAADDASDRPRPVVAVGVVSGRRKVHAAGTGDLVTACNAAVTDPDVTDDWAWSRACCAARWWSK